MGLWTLLEGFLLLANALAILNEDRFLTPRGWGLSDFSAGQTKSFKGQLIGLIYATQYLRFPLLLLNSVFIIVKLVSGWCLTRWEINTYVCFRHVSSALPLLLFSDAKFYFNHNNICCSSHLELFLCLTNKQNTQTWIIYVDISDKRIFLIVLKPGLDQPVRPATSHVSSPTLSKNQCVLKLAKNRWTGQKPVKLGGLTSFKKLSKRCRFGFCKKNKIL